jgi:indolepyruvate ferredoxin oxidoreductase alpha subunit
MKKLLTGNEGVARGAYEAGVVYAAAYPGTPSTEILETIGNYKGDIIAEWAPNEKVAVECAIGASLAGGRAITAMKMVGLNVAADPFFSGSYAGVNGGLVVVDADDPGLHSSQDEQDNRHFAPAAKVAMVEPSDSQEAKDMVIAAMEISEKYDTPVLYRMTTRVCHSKGLVEFGERREMPKKPYVKQFAKTSLIPAHAKQRHYDVEERLLKLAEYSEETPLNFIDWNDKKIGIISSGVAYQYAREVFGDTASYLKIGMSYPLPMKKIKAFAAEVETLYVIEELDPYMEEQIKAAGIDCIGKAKIPNIEELNPDIIARALLGKERPLISYDKSKVVGRPPTLCAGCPHRGFFYALGKKKNTIIMGDIGCYGLGGAEPLNAQDTCICMGSSISTGHGAAKVFKKYNDDMRVVAVLGDSTFFHTGMNSLLQVVYNNSKVVTCILDNRITGMTGHQENPGSGFTLQGDPAVITDIAAVVKALGVKYVRTVNPLDLKAMDEAIEWGFSCDGPSVIITRWPCVLKKHTPQDIEEFGHYKGTCRVDPAICIGCRKCTTTGCPALVFHKEDKKVVIDEVQCDGCRVCAQVCPVNAIERVGDK